MSRNIFKYHLRNIINEDGQIFSNKGIKQIDIVKSFKPFMI